MCRAALRTVLSRERPWPGRCPGLADPASVPQATGVRCGPPVVRCGYGSSLTSPRVTDRARPGSLWTMTTRAASQEEPAVLSC